MPSVVVVGAQWGDEGKGKVTDYLAAQADLVVRYQGGNNAGHTVVVNGHTFRLHLVPSGVIHPHVTCIIGNGVVVDPFVLVKELDNLSAMGVGPINLLISERAHVIMPYHRLLDSLEEERRGVHRIGTTGCGIGPAYTDKVARCGVCMVDLISEATLRSRLETVLPAKNQLLQALYAHQGYQMAELIDQFKAVITRLSPSITDTAQIIIGSMGNGQRVLFEGAQGALLDIDHGTYPYVTSSTTTAAGAAVGSGVGPHALNTILGVSKAYTTRVGEGPFPSELHDDIGAIIRQRGGEYGTTTGRPRRCGWFDAVVARYAVQVNGIDKLAIMKLDVLSGLDEMRICTAYKYRGQQINHFPTRLDVLQECEPVYETLPGWSQELENIRSYSMLPEAARNYLQRLADLIEAPISIISVGPGREQTIIREELF